MPYAEVNLSVVATSVALLAGPWLAGVALGSIFVRTRGRRASGFLAFAACVTLPPATLLFAVSRAPIVGIWDAVLEGALLGFGLLVAIHSAFRDPRTVATVSLASAIGLGAVELASRFALPEAPAMTMGRVPHLFLVDAPRDDRMQPGDASMRNVVCRMAYGDSYRPPTGYGAFDGSILLPQDADLPDRPHAVLHVGDSMVYGFGVGRDVTFAAGLTRLQHDTIHVNAGMPGAGPDAYLVALRSWLSGRHFDLVLMYLFEGNDIRDLDSPFPCTHWQPLLTYSADGAALRYQQPQPFDPETSDWTWLRRNSPPPYLVRAALPFSQGARQVAARLVLAARNGMEMSNEEYALRFEHLEAVLRSGRDDAEAHGTRFAVVILPDRWTIDGPGVGKPVFRDSIASRIPEIAGKLGIPYFDAQDVVRESVTQGESLYLGPNDCHFNAAGHQVMARWLDPRIASLSSQPVR